MLITKIFFREARYDIPLNTVFIKMMKNFFGWFFCLTAISATGYANELEVDWAYISTLSGSNFIEYFENQLKFEGDEAMAFWKEIPVSKANQQIYRIYRKQKFASFLEKHPSRFAANEYSFEFGKGKEIIGPKSKQPLNLPFPYILPLSVKAIGDYKIGYTIHGFSHPWLLNNADSAIWEAEQHPNIELNVLDPDFNEKKQAEHIKQWVAEKYEGFMIWPRVEGGPAASVITEALTKGIKVVSIDRFTGVSGITHRIVADFPANGVQQGLYLIHKLLEEQGAVKGNIVMIRKPINSSADVYRTGHFLKIASYFPGLRIIAAYHNNSSREKSREQVLEVLNNWSGSIDIIFCTGSGQSMGAIDALNETGKWFARKGNRKIILLSNDDAKASMNAIKVGKQDMLAPYTPLLGGIGMRALLYAIVGKKQPRDIIIPYLPMVTQKPQKILGIQTLGVEQWMPYAYGPDDPQEPLKP
ncbi:MAG: sugar ABC transporter substrate-binding protein [Candidatus Parabeggiatoa sp. nov. 1]|nr:MAG: sugar ABC transporter substrate-binding protein [Gammaproteobacteria bacterium]